MIRIEKLNKSYGTKKVLTDIDLEFSEGGVYGIVGENGAGKTTLFKCIAGLEQFNGTIHTDHSPLKDVLGFLPTDPIFLSHVTAWEYLKLFCVARGVETENFEEQNIFDLPLNEYAANYSTGMKKKLAIMAVLLQQNKVFILDEPFNGVDIQSNIIITALIKKLKSKGKTILISSHIFSTLKETCDSIFLLQEGKITKYVKPEQFDELESEMKARTIDDTIDRLII